MAHRWCDRCGCWCSDAEDITDGMGDCDYECSYCEDCEEVKSEQRRDDRVFEAALGIGFVLILVAVMMYIPIDVIRKNPELAYKLHQEQEIILTDQVEKLTDPRGRDYGLH